MLFRSHNRREGEGGRSSGMRVYDLRHFHLTGLREQVVQHGPVFDDIERAVAGTHEFAVRLDT